MINGVYLTGGTRTAMGAFCGSFETVSAAALGSAVIRGALRRAGVTPDAVDFVLMGNVISAGQGQNIARQAAIAAGISPSVGGMTINRACASGLQTVMLAAQGIRCGDASIIVAGGTENMTRAPYLVEKGRTGYRMGHGEFTDALMRDALWDIFSDVHMGASGELCAQKYGFTREQQDEFAICSYRRAIEATAKGIFAREIEPMPVKAGREMVNMAEDENLKKFNDEKLRKLRPAFSEKGTITAGNASSINDGAAAVVVISEQKMKALDSKPQARVVGYTSYSREPALFTLAPVSAVSKLLKMISWQPSDVDLFEINEAFCGVPMSVMKDLNIPHEKVNVMGGAVALGHPVGASGARILVTLMNALKERGGRRGIAALCVGGGEAVAMAVELV